MTAATPSPISTQSATAATARYAVGFDTTAGRYPAAHSQARYTPATDATTSRNAASRRSRSTSVNDTRAATGRNNATDHDPGPPPGASRTRAAKSGRPMVEPSAGEGPPPAARSAGKARDAPATAIPIDRGRPRNLPPRPGTRRTARNITPNDSAAPGANDTATARTSPAPTMNRKGREPDQQCLLCQRGAPEQDRRQDPEHPQGWTSRVGSPERRGPDSREQLVEEPRGGGREPRERTAGERVVPHQVTGGQGPQDGEHEPGHAHRVGPGQRDRAGPDGRQLELVLLVDRGLVAVELLVEGLLTTEQGRGHLQPPAKADALRRHVPADGPVGDGAHGLGPDPAADGPGEVQEVPPPCRHHLPGLLEPPAEGVQDGLPGGLEGVQGEQPQQREQAVVLQHRGQDRK